MTLQQLLRLLLAATAVLLTSLDAPAQCGPLVQRELFATDPQSSAQLGQAIDLEGDTLAAGAPQADFDPNAVKFRGAAYVWRKGATGWQVESKIPGPGAPYTYFGGAVALDGDLMIASGFSGSFPYERAWLCQRSGSSWSVLGDLVPADPSASGAKPPRACGIAGGWAAVGHYATFGTPVTSQRSGAVYLYHDVGGIWQQAAKLVPADSSAGDEVGWALDLDGTTLAYSSRTSGSTGDGRVHVVSLASGGPQLEATLGASAAQHGTAFGRAIAVDGTRLAASDIGDSEVPGQQGAVYVFVRQGATWVEEQVVRPALPAGVSAQFGRTVALESDDLFVGAGAPERVWHFRRVQGTWIELGQAAQPTASGWSVAALSAASGALAAGSPTSLSNGQVTGSVVLLDPSASALACVYCAAKVNSLGCTPAIGFAGTASTGSATGFTVSATAIVPHVNGLLFYSTGAAQAAPFQGGTLCMQGSVHRTTLAHSGGSTGCSGSFSFDFNAWVTSGADPLLATGSVVRAQFWSRDPSASFSTNLTDAVCFVLQP